MKIDKYFTLECIQYIKKEIQNANFNEVFFTGKIDAKGVIVDIKVGSRGSEHSVSVNQNDVKTSNVLIHNHPGGDLTPSAADLSVASRASENVQGFYIVNNDVTDVYVVVEPIKPVVLKKIDKDNSAQMISNNGSLSKLSNSFEERKSQIDLLKAVVDVFNENKIGVFEAGTGVGKSYAYLIPSIVWAIENKEKVVISTGTINLQQQLCKKDIPAVEKILGKKIKYILMKGRQNYVCLRRMNDAAQYNDLFDDDKENLQKLIEWAKNSSSGDKSDLSFFPSENSWSKINSESDACMGMRCPYRNECFVMKVRKEASDSSIIVVNHHLLFADIQSRMGGIGYNDMAVLPSYKRIVFDEAHGVESAATSFFSESVNRFKINKLLNLMYRKRKSSESGFLCSLAILSSNEEKAGQAYEITNKIKDNIIKFEVASKDLLENNSTIRLYEQTARNHGPVLICIGELAHNLGLFTNMVREVMEGINEDDCNMPAYWETKIILRRLDNYVVLLKNYCAWDEKKDDVFWMQLKRLPVDMSKDNQDREYITLTQTPLDISSFMNNGVYEQMSSIVFTSATLKTGESYRFWMNRTGISFVEQQRLLSGEYLSPFPYEKNMIFAVPNDAPLPDSSTFQPYIEMAIPLLIKAADGRTLILFTSYESLKSAYKNTISVMKDFDGRILKQGDEDNSKLLNQFKDETRSVLFATDSFWQGVDIPGESLSQVIIVKLPFTVPNDPIFTARSEAIQKKGGNSFMELSIPESIIKFRQGVGRLIRTSEDKGVVVVLDRRIYEKKYGSLYIKSISECKKIYEPLSELSDTINQFIFY